MASSGACLGQEYQKELLKKSSYHRVNNNKDSSFYSNLKIKHPKLSKFDIVFTTLVAMNMTNKEIATSKSMSSYTVKTTKNRLKKKLNIASTEKLVDYLKELL